jgi:hypothetical protein
VITLAYIGNTENAVYIPTIIAQKTLQAFPSYLNLARTISRDSDWAVADMGETIQVPKTGAVTANDKVAGSNYTRQGPTGTNVEVTLDTHKEVTISLNDVTKVLQNQDTQQRYAEDAAIALADAVETSVASLHASVENTVTWDSSSATTIDTSMLAIRKFFTDQKVPKPEQRHMYVDSTVFNDLLSTDKFSRYDARGTGDQITTGQLIKAYGMDIWESQIIQTSGSPVAYHNLAYTKNGFILASRPLANPGPAMGVASSVINDPSIGLSLRTFFWYDADKGEWVLTLDLLYGVAILDQRRVVEVEST